jgi:hypothetical protein
MDIMDRSRRFVTELVEVNGQTFSRLVELQAGALQRLADANRARVRAVTDAGGLADVVAAQRDYYGQLGRTARAAVTEQVSTLRDGAVRSGGALRATVRPQPAAEPAPAQGPTAV